MKHLGDINRLSGYDLPPVDVVIGGSPCQDLSVSGKRKGLVGERSSLFLEQIRLIKELRDADRKRGRTGIFVRPRFMVWENVPGAFSSNKGGDFQQVLQETIRIAEPEAPDIPLPDKWPLADSYYGDGWSVAYRVLDAQFWGVPQRRRRIALVADFGGLSAPEILFVRKGLSWDSTESGTAKEGTARSVEDGTYPAIARSLTARYDGSPCIDRGPNIIVQGAYNPWDSQSARIYPDSEPWHSLSANNNGGQSRDAVFCIQGNVIDRDVKQNGSGIQTDVAYTLNGVDRHVVCAEFIGSQGAKAGNIGFSPEQCPTLTCDKGMHVYDARGNGDGSTACTLTGDHQNRVTDYTAIVCGFKSFGDYQITDTGKTLMSCDDITTGDLAINSGIVRRLTPLECTRLQGFPDGWVDIGDWTDSKGKRHKESDSAKYKALGNSIALPPWKWVLKRISAQYERDATLGSLFDGIGGFPLLWEQINGKGSALWASEVDEFCIAVTKMRIGGPHE